MIHCLTVENVIIGKAFPKFHFFVLLTFHLSSPSHLSHLIPDCNVFPSLHIFVRHSSLLRTYDVTDRSLPPSLLSHFRSPASHFSFLISLPSFFFCPRLALSTPLAVVSILSLSLNTVHPSVYISYYPPFPASCSLILLPSPPALVD